MAWKVDRLSTLGKASQDRSVDLCCVRNILSPYASVNYVETVRRDQP
jgi:hypothetical protein